MRSAIEHVAMMDVAMQHDDIARIVEQPLRPGSSLGEEPAMGLCR